MAKRYTKIADFQDRPSVLGPLSAARLNAINAGLDAVDIYKVDVDQIIHTTAVNDTGKIPSSAVTHGLGQSVAAINDSLSKTAIEFTSSAGLTLGQFFGELCTYINTTYGTAGIPLKGAFIFSTQTGTEFYHGFITGKPNSSFYSMMLFSGSGAACYHVYRSINTYTYKQITEGSATTFTV